MIEFRLKMGHVVSKLAQIAIFLRENGHIDEAISCLNVLSEGDSTFEAGSYAYDLGLCYQLKGDEARARQYFLEAVKNNPAITQYRNAAEASGVDITQYPDPTK